MSQRQSLNGRSPRKPTMYCPTVKSDGNSRKSRPMNRWLSVKSAPGVGRDARIVAQVGRNERIGRRHRRNHEQGRRPAHLAGGRGLVVEELPVGSQRVRDVEVELSEERLALHRIDHELLVGHRLANGAAGRAEVFGRRPLVVEGADLAEQRAVVIEAEAARIEHRAGRDTVVAEHGVDDRLLRQVGRRRHVGARADERGQHAELVEVAVLAPQHIAIRVARGQQHIAAPFGDGEAAGDSDIE